jgi:hypothetical protein
MSGPEEPHVRAIGPIKEENRRYVGHLSAILLLGIALYGLGAPAYGKARGNGRRIIGRYRAAARKMQADCVFEEILSVIGI